MHGYIFMHVVLYHAMLSSFCILTARSTSCSTLKVPGQTFRFSIFSIAMQLLKDRGYQWCGRRLRRRLPGGVGEEAFGAGVLPGAMR